MKKTTRDDLSLRHLNEFTKAVCYHNFFGTKVTDGIVYLIKNGYAWFVQDAIRFIQNEGKKIRNIDFLVIKLLLNKDKRKKGEATFKILKAYKSNVKVIYTRKHIWTTAKVELRLFYKNGVLRLPSEY